MMKKKWKKKIEKRERRGVSSVEMWVMLDEIVLNSSKPDREIVVCQVWKAFVLSIVWKFWHPFFLGFYSDLVINLWTATNVFSHCKYSF